MKPNWKGNDGKNHTIFYCGDEAGNNSFLILKGDDNKLKFITSNNKSESANNPTIGVGAWLKNEWHHLTFTWTPTGTKEIYIDGHLKASEINNKMPSRLYSRLFIGSTDELIGGFDGVIDEVRISNIVRSADELREYMASGYYESPILDAGDIVEWGTIKWDSDVKSETTLFLQTSTSQDNTTWTNWTGSELGAWYDKQLKRLGPFPPPPPKPQASSSPKAANGPADRRRGRARQSQR